MTGENTTLAAIWRLGTGWVSRFRQIVPVFPTAICEHAYARDIRAPKSYPRKALSIRARWTLTEGHKPSVDV